MLMCWCADVLMGYELNTILLFKRFKIKVNTRMFWICIFWRYFFFFCRFPYLTKIAVDIWQFFVFCFVIKWTISIQDVKLAELSEMLLLVAMIRNKKWRFKIFVCENHSFDSLISIWVQIYISYIFASWKD